MSAGESERNCSRESVKRSSRKYATEYRKRSTKRHGVGMSASDPKRNSTRESVKKSFGRMPSSPRRRAPAWHEVGMSASESRVHEEELQEECQQSKEKSTKRHEARMSVSENKRKGTRGSTKKSSRKNAIPAPGCRGVAWHPAPAGIIDKARIPMRRMPNRYVTKRAVPGKTKEKSVTSQHHEHHEQFP